MKRNNLVINGIDYNVELDNALARIKRNIQFKVDIHAMVHHYENISLVTENNPYKNGSIFDQVSDHYKKINKAIINTTGIPNPIFGTDLNIEGTRNVRDYLAERARMFGTPIRVKNTFFFSPTFAE